MREETINLEDIFYALKKKWKFIVVITLLFTLGAGVMSFYVIKPTYEGKVKVFIGKEGASNTENRYNNGDVVMYQSLMKTYSEFIKTKDSTKKALESAKMDGSQGNVNRVLSGLTVSPSEETQIMTICYKSKDKGEITKILAAVTNNFMTQSKELIPNGNVQVIQKAEEPRGAIAPNKMQNTAIGFLLGLMVALGIVFLREYLDNTFKRAEEVEELLAVPVIGIIPLFSKDDLSPRKVSKKEKEKSKEIDAKEKKEAKKEEKKEKKQGKGKEIKVES